MNRRTLTRGFALCIALALTACASAPSQELSILDAMAAQPMNKPLACAGMNAATMCVKSTRIGKYKNCGCVDRRELTGGTLRGF
jgi:hypothetical protein